MNNIANIRFARKSLFVLVASSVLAACSAGSGDPLQDASAAIDQQDYRAARIHLMTALRANSADPQANYLYAKTLIALGDGVTAQASLKKLAAHKQYAERVQPLLARAHIFIGKPEKALQLAANPSGQHADQLYAVQTLALIALEREVEADAVLDEGLRASPDSAELRWIKGNRDLEIGNIDAAVQSAKRAVALQPDSAEARLLLGRISLTKSDGKKALLHFAKVKELRPDLIMADFLRGTILKDLGQREEARQCFNAVLSASPAHPWATYLLAEMDFGDGKSTQAIERLRASKAKLDGIPQALRLRGILEIKRGNHEQAINKLNRYLAKNSADAQAIMALTRAYASAGNNGQAFRTIMPLTRSVTAPTDALTLAAELARKVDDPVAVNLSQRAAALASDPAKNQLFEAEHAIISQDWSRAEKIYAKLLRQESKQKVMLLNNAAMVQLNLGKADAAIKLARQANKLAPGDPIVQDTLGWILLQTRTDTVRALELIQKAATEVPGNGEIHWHLANALAVNGQKAEARKLAVKLAGVADQGEQVQLSNLLAWI